MSPIPNQQPGDVVNEIFSEYLPSIIQICTDVGDDPNVLIEEVRNELKKMAIQMMAEDQALIDRKRTELASIRSRYESLFYELYPDKSCPNHEHSLAILPALRIYLDDYEKLREEHEKLLEKELDIRDEEKQLCKELNECSLQTDSIDFLNKPLVNQMSLLAEHIEKLRDEKKKRIAHLSDIFKSLNEFELIYGWKRPKVETKIGQLLSNGIPDIEQFTLTKESIDLIDKEFVEINEQIQKAEACFEQSNKQLNLLMRKHQSLIPSVKVLTLTKTKQCRLSKLPDLIAEVDRYKEHAMEKLTSDILKTRERIYAVLGKLAVVDAMNNSKYSILYTNEFTEDIYFMHEELLQELESQYETNKSIYEQIELWNDIFLEYQEFERNASDPQRFHRRGYSALAEEKTRKKFEANLRDCENRLHEIAEDFIKKNNGQPFLMSGSGLEISEYIQKQKEKYLQSKEHEREMNKTPASKKKARTENVMRARPAALQTVPGKDENNKFNEDNKCATTLCVPNSKKKKLPF